MKKKKEAKWARQLLPTVCEKEKKRIRQTLHKNISRQYHIEYLLTTKWIGRHKVCGHASIFVQFVDYSSRWDLKNRVHTSTLSPKCTKQIGQMCKNVEMSTALRTAKPFALNIPNFIRLSSVIWEWLEKYRAEKLVPYSSGEYQHMRVSHELVCSTKVVRSKNTLNTPNKISKLSISEKQDKSVPKYYSPYFAYKWVRGSTEK